MSINAVGIPWYRKETYRAARALFIDGAKFPVTYEDWLKDALEVENRIKANGEFAVRAHIDPTAFRLWAEQRGLPLDWSARSAFANQMAHEEYMKSNDPAAVRVAFPDGYAEIGIQIAPTVVELGPAAVDLQVREPMQIDGRSVLIAAKTVWFKKPIGPNGSDVERVRIAFEELKQ